MLNRVLHTLVITCRIFLIMCVLVLFSCTNKSYRGNEKIVVSIMPIKYLVEGIIGDDLEVAVLVPPGSSPETYEITSGQLIELQNARLVFTTGLIDFENELFSKLTNNPVELHNGIKLIEGSCGHIHSLDHHTHAHGIDPHIWTSPKQLKTMSENAYKAISLLYPDSVKYRENYLALIDKLDILDEEITETINRANMKTFFIYHPALTYYSNDYGLTQVAIEADGKEPSASRLQYLVDLAHSEGITKLLYQREFSRTAVEIIAKDIDAELIEIDPLAEDVVRNIREITRIIAE